MLVVLPLCWMPAERATTEPPVGPACRGCCRIINAATAVMVAKRGRTRRAVVEAPDVTSGPARRQHLRITQQSPTLRLPKQGVVRALTLYLLEYIASERIGSGQSLPIICRSCSTICCTRCVLLDTVNAEMYSHWWRASPTRDKHLQSLDVGNVAERRAYRLRM